MAGIKATDPGGVPPPSPWEREVMLKCAKANSQYMRATPAGQHFPSLARFYARLADQGVVCARAWREGEPPPPHEPAVDAFWWAVAGWAVVFMTDVAGRSPEVQAGAVPGGVLHHELQERFTRPHLRFAIWLNPRRLPALYDVPRRELAPDQLIIYHDYYWAKQVIRLTASWGLREHLKDLPALFEALALLRRLRAFTQGRPEPVARAYLRSDLMFFEELFGHFGFSDRTSAVLDQILSRAAARTRRICTLAADISGDEK
jgi:hypothetical protein